MKILFVAPYIPSKIRIRSYHFIKGLKNSGHSITFLGLADSYASKETLNELRKYCDTLEIFRIPKIYSHLNCFITLFGKMPLQSAYCFSMQMKRRINQISLHLNHDLIHIEHIRAGYLLPEDRHIPAVYDSVDCITSLYQRFKTERTSHIGKLIASIESRKLEKSEPCVLSKYNGVVVTAFRDKYFLESLSQKIQCIIPEIEVIANGVDFEYFKPQNAPYKRYSIVFAGKMGYFANELAALHFVREIFPIIKSKITNAQFYIVGANPSKTVRKLNENEDIIVTGMVPDIRKYLNLAHVVVCPVQVSAGIQNKLLEAMSMAKAVVTYPEAASPLHTQSESMFLIANEPKEFAENILKLMDNEPLRVSMGLNARAYVQEFYNWDTSVKRLEELYIRAIQTYNYDGVKRKNWQEMR